MRKEIICTFKKKKNEQLILERDEKHNISICLLNEQKEKKAILHVRYYLRESLSIEEVRSFSVHLQTIWVHRKYRRRGIAALIMSVLIDALLEVEQEEHCRFTLIRGEIGNAGEDNPRLSKPFYRAMDGMAYGTQRKLVLKLEKNSTEDGLDEFWYYILPVEKIP